MAEMHAGLRFASLSVNFDGTNLRLTGLIRGALFSCAVAESQCCAIRNGAQSRT
jgi:hypothetical protein